MANQPDTTVLQHLEHIRGKVDLIDGKFGGIEDRITALEADFLVLAKAEATRSIDFAAIIKRVARMETRLTRLESAGKKPGKSSAAKPPKSRSQ
ncbi:MAG: hypothetical protein AAFR55_04040 [Pseudomonadota bacterium]